MKTKPRILCLLKILGKYTDQENPLTTNQLISLLKSEYDLNVHRITLKKDIEALQSVGYSYYSLCYLSRDIESKYFIEATFDLKEGVNKKVKSNASELEKIVNETERIVNILNDLPNSFSRTLDIHIKRKNYTNEKLEELSHISEKTIRNIRKNPNARPSLKTVLALCIGLNLHPMFIFDLIAKAGYDIINSASKENVIYRYLINNHHMENINMWNEFLENAKLNPLEKNYKKTEV